MKKILFILLVLVYAHCKTHQILSIYRHGARYYLNQYYDWNDTFWG